MSCSSLAAHPAANRNLTNQEKTTFTSVILSMMDLVQVIKAQFNPVCANYVDTHSI
jgi:hypothetical protein